MLELDIDSELTIQMFDKAMLPEYEAYKMTLIPVSLDTLLDNKLYQYVRNGYKPNIYKRFGFLIDVSKSTKDFDVEELKSSLFNWKDMGFEISIQGYSYLVNNALVLDIAPRRTVVEIDNINMNGIQTENTIKFAMVFSEDVAIVNSEMLKHEQLIEYGIRLKDRNFSRVELGYEELEELESIV
jgi:hypothetical protein